MAGEGPPSTPFLRHGPKVVDWRACARHDVFPNAFARPAVVARHEAAATDVCHIRLVSSGRMGYAMSRISLRGIDREF